MIWMILGSKHVSSNRCISCAWSVYAGSHRHIQDVTQATGPDEHHQCVRAGPGQAQGHQVSYLTSSVVQFTLSVAQGLSLTSSLHSRCNYPTDASISRSAQPIHKYRGHGGRRGRREVFMDFNPQKEQKAPPVAASGHRQTSAATLGDLSSDCAS